MEFFPRLDRRLNACGKGVCGSKLREVLLGGVPAEDVVEKGVRLVGVKTGKEIAEAQNVATFGEILAQRLVEQPGVAGKAGEGEIGEVLRKEGARYAEAFGLSEYGGAPTEAPEKALFDL